MNTPLQPPVFPRSTGTDDVDRQLWDFFRAEMPNPWPKITFPAQVPLRQRPGTQSRFAKRVQPLALAAAVALLLIGYLTLASLFPSNVSHPTLPGDSPHIGQKPGRKEPVRIFTPRGNEAHGWEKDGDGVFHLYLERLPGPAKR